MNESMTDQEIREIEALAEKATPGPWLAPGGAIVRAPKNPGIAGSLSDAVCTAFTANRNNRDASANTAFIAASRTAVPRMAAEIRRLWAENEALRHIITTMTHEEPKTYGANSIRITVQNECVSVDYNGGQTDE